MPANRRVIDEYIHNSPIKDIELLLRSINPYWAPPNQDINERISSYVQAEEDRLESNLQGVAYNIDAFNTLTLIGGTQRVEKVNSSIPL